METYLSNSNSAAPGYHGIIGHIAECLKWTNISLWCSAQIESMSEGIFLHVSAHFIIFAIILLSAIEWFKTVSYIFHMNSYRNFLRLYVHSLNRLTYMSKMTILALESGYNNHLGVGIWQESQIIMGSNWDPVHSPSQLQVLWSCMFMFLSVQLIGLDTHGGGFTIYTRETRFLTPFLLSCTQAPSEKGLR